MLQIKRSWVIKGKQKTKIRKAKDYPSLCNCFQHFVFVGGSSHICPWPDSNPRCCCSLSVERCPTFLITCIIRLYLLPVLSKHFGTELFTKVIQQSEGSTEERVKEVELSNHMVESYVTVSTRKRTREKDRQQT